MSQLLLSSYKFCYKVITPFKKEEEKKATFAAKIQKLEVMPTATKW